MFVGKVGHHVLLNEVIVTGAGAASRPVNTKRTFQAKGNTSAGAGTATVLIEGSNDGTNFITLATISLVLGVAETSDGVSMDSPWKYVRADLTVLTGTNATVSVFMGA